MPIPADAEQVQANRSDSSEEESMSDDGKNIQSSEEEYASEDDKVELLDEPGVEIKLDSTG